MLALEQSGFETWGLEPSLSFRNRAVSAGVTSGRLALSPVEQADYPASTFDFVTFSAVLEHLHDPAACLTRALEWTTADGLIHLEVPSANWLMARLVNRAYRLRGLDYVTNLSPMHPPFHLYEFTLESFGSHVQNILGFELIAHRVHVCDTFLPRPMQGIATRIMERSHTGMQLEVWLRARH
jgi:hypothetical protein